MRVNFMIIGAQKCGTTTLTRILKSHPGIVGCNVKEPHFFSETPNWREEINQYHSLFPQINEVMYFEASTSYTFYPHRNLHIWDDIYEYNRDMKFIYLVRNPFDRIRSSYMHAYERGYTDYTFEEAIVKDRFHIDITRYYMQIIPYIRKFGADKVLIIEFNELVNNRDQLLHKVADFLSINADRFPDLGEVHSNKSVGGHKLHHKYDSPGIHLKIIRKFFPTLWQRITDNTGRIFETKPELKDEYKELIIHSLRLDINELQKLMNADLSNWLKDDTKHLSATLEP